MGITPTVDKNVLNVVLEHKSYLGYLLDSYSEYEIKVVNPKMIKTFLTVNYIVFTQ